MSYYLDHSHLENLKSQFRSGSSAETYGSVVGVVEKSTEKPITGRSGDHLQFTLSIGNGQRYQVDVNTQSEDGQEIGLYIAEQTIAPVGNNPSEPFGAPAYGAFTRNVALSYAAIGLTDADFTPASFGRIDSQLEADLNAATFVAAYGLMFDDGGTNGKGIHETHYTGKDQQDGALALYTIDPSTKQPTRIWYYFKFQNDSIG